MASNAYQLLVSSPDDIVGLLTYSLYKDSKLSFITDYVCKHGREPSEADVESFLLTALSAQNIDRLRSQAIKLVGHLLDNVAQDEIDRAIQELRQKQLDDVREAVSACKPNRVGDFFVGVLSALGFALLLSITQIIVKYQGGDLLMLFR